MARWSEVRAGLIALTIFFGLVEGCPLPSPKHTPEWEKGFVEPIRSVQDVFVWPVLWIETTFRVDQLWALYQHPGGEHWRLAIDGQTADGTWHLLFLSGDAEHADDADLFESAHVWGAYSPTDRAADQYTLFCRWVSARELARHPELVAVRIRQEKIVIEAGVVRPTGQYGYGYSRAR